MEDPTNPKDKFDLDALLRSWGEDTEDEPPMFEAGDLESFEKLKQEVQRHLAKLSEEERGLLRDRFGLEDGRSRSIEEIATAKNLTPEQVEEIERVALAKLHRG